MEGEGKRESNSLCNATPCSPLFSGRGTGRDGPLVGATVPPTERSPLFSLRSRITQRCARVALPPPLPCSVPSTLCYPPPLFICRRRTVIRSYRLLCHFPPLPRSPTQLQLNSSSTQLSRHSPSRHLYPVSTAWLHDVLSARKSLKERPDLTHGSKKRQQKTGQ